MNQSLTINGGLALQKALRSRVNELLMLRDNVAVEETTTYFSDPKSEKIKVVKYEVKFVDKKITQLQNVLFKLDNAIKTANAKTSLGIEVDVDACLAPLE